MASRNHWNNPVYQLDQENMELGFILTAIWKGSGGVSITNLRANTNTLDTQTCTVRSKYGSLMEPQYKHQETGAQASRASPAIQALAASAEMRAPSDLTKGAETTAITLRLADRSSRMMRSLLRYVTARISIETYERLLTHSVLRQYFKELVDVSHGFNRREDLWSACLEKFHGPITYIEFGVYEGYSIKFFADKNANPRLDFYWSR